MPRPRRKKSKMYFGTPAQEAIIAYNKCKNQKEKNKIYNDCLLYTSPSPRDRTRCRMPSSA